MNLDWDALTGEQRRRWNTVLSHLVTAIPPGDPAVIVDGVDGRAVLFADRLAAAMRDTGRPCARHLPIRDAAADAVFAAGLIMHPPDTDTGLLELARVTRRGGKLVLFHPSGRAALAARQDRILRPDDPLAETPLSLAAQRTGWDLVSYDDPPERFLAVATRG